MAARITREQAARWQVIVPWQRGDVISEVIAAELTTTGTDITIELIGNKNPITFPLERAKLLSDALREAVESVEKSIAVAPA